MVLATGAAARLMAPVRADLVAWRLISAPQPDDALVFPRPDGDEWRTDDWNDWRDRVFRPASSAVGLPTAIRPYDLRHSAASCGCTRAAASSSWPSGWFTRRPCRSTP